MTVLERRCRRLLRAYPASYRADWEDELIATFLDLAGPGQSWPSWREALAFVAGGLRMRARQPSAANLRLAVMLGLAATVALLGCGSAGGIWLRVDVNNPIILRGGGDLSGSWAGVPFSDLWPTTAAFALTACAPAAIWIGRRAVAVTVLLAAALALPYVEAANFGGAFWSGQMITVGLPLSLLLAALAVLTALGTHRPPRIWFCWYALPPVWILDERIANMLPFAIGRVLVELPLFPAFFFGAILWVIFDARPTLALATVLAVLGLGSAAGGVGPHPSGQPVRLAGVVFYLVLIVALAVPALLRMRRQAVV
jgi:hypothetical protein